MKQYLLLGEVGARAYGCIIVMGLTQWLKQNPPLHERLHDSTDLFVLAPWRKFPKLKLWGWFVLFAQLECLVVIPIGFIGDPRTADLTKMSEVLCMPSDIEKGICRIEGEPLYEATGEYGDVLVWTAIPLILIGWTLKDAVDAVWCLGQCFVTKAGRATGVECFILGLLKLTIWGFAVMTAFVYAAVRPAVWEVIIESVTVLLILDIDGQAYVTAKAVAPLAIDALEDWAAGRDAEIEEQRSGTAKPAASEAEVGVEAA